MSAIGLEIRAFGGLSVLNHGVPATIGSRQRRVLLAMLLARRGNMVPVARLMDALWRATPPPTAAKSLQVQVHKLRRILGDPATVRYQHPGYLLAVPEDCIDLYRFENLVDRGRAMLRSDHAADAGALLQAALTLYRGPAFEGLEDIDDLAVESRRLAELWLAAAEDRFAAGLATGNQADLVPELEALTTLHPLRERLRSQLMTALYRSGRKADALAVYQSGRNLLVAELGMEPSEECQAVHRAILTDDPALSHPRLAPEPVAAKPPRPRQLPADVAHFTGRVQQVRWLDELLTRSRSAPIVVIDGQPGVGKTALALHWAYRRAERFEDGQLFVNLRGYAASAPRRPIDALSQLLCGLGVREDQLPSDLDEAATQFRSLVADQRILLLLDDATDADQVRPLLPGGAGCVTVITSRSHLTGLIARDGAHRMSLGVLSAGEAVALVSSFVGPLRVAAEPVAAAELAELCARLPLALRVAAANLAGDPRQRIADWVTRLRGDGGLTALAVPDDRTATITAALELSYLRLPPPAQRMFRRLGLVPGVEATAASAARLADLTTAEAAQVLATLATANLVEEPRPGRFALHDLLRRFAAARAHVEEPRPEPAISRYFYYFLVAANAAHEVLYPHNLRLPGEARAPASAATHFADAAEAFAWLEVERDTLITIISHTARHGPYPVAWRLADAVRSYLTYGSPTTDVLLVAEAAAAAAAADANPLAQASALLTATAFHLQQGEYPKAQEHAHRAWQLVRDTDWDAGQGVVRNLLALTYANLGELAAAVDHYLAALTRFEQIGWLHGQALVVSNLSTVLLELGQLQRAASCARKAAAVFARLGSPLSHAHSLIDLGECCHLLGQLAEAVEHFGRAQEGCQTAGSRAGEAEAMRGLAAVRADLGQLRTAQELAERSVAIIQNLGDRRLEPHCLATLAGVRHRRQDLAGAVLGYRQAVELAGGTGDRYLETLALIGLASVHPPMVDYGDCRAWAEQALYNAERHGFRLLQGQALVALAGIDLATGAAREAIARAERALACHQQIQHRLGEAHSQLLLADACQRNGDPAAARRYRQRAHSLLAEIGAPVASDAAAARLDLATDRPERGSRDADAPTRAGGAGHGLGSM